MKMKINYLIKNENGRTNNTFNFDVFLFILTNILGYSLEH
jgi:hypothetical protein